MAPLRLAGAHASGPPAMTGVAPALEEITRACLANNPSDRPPDAGSVAAQLRAFPILNPEGRDLETRAIPLRTPANPPPTEGRRSFPRFPLAGVATAALVAVLLAVALLSPGGKQAAGAPEAPSSTPAPAWVTQLAAAYSDACNASLDPAQIDGLAQPDAEARVSTLIESCVTVAEPAAGSSGGGGGSGSGGGAGKGKGKGHR